MSEQAEQCLRKAAQSLAKIESSLIIFYANQWSAQERNTNNQ